MRTAPPDVWWRADPDLAGGPHFEAKENAEGGPGLRSAAELTWGLFPITPGIGIGGRRGKCFAGIPISRVHRPPGLDLHAAIFACRVVAEAAQAGPPARAASARAGVDGQSPGRAQTSRYWVPAKVAQLLDRHPDIPRTMRFGLRRGPAPRKAPGMLRCTPHTWATVAAGSAADSSVRPSTLQTGNRPLTKPDALLFGNCGKDADHCVTERTARCEAAVTHSARGEALKVLKGFKDPPCSLWPSNFVLFPPPVPGGSVQRLNVLPGQLL